MRQATCRDIERALQDLVDGLLPSDEAARLHGHAESCSRCRARVERRTALRRALTPPPEIELPSGFRASLLDRLHEAAAAPEAAPVPYTPPAISWGDRVAEWWSGVRMSPIFQPAAVLAGVAMAVVLASVAAQVVGTWRSRESGSPAGSPSQQVAQQTPGSTPVPVAPPSTGDATQSPVPAVDQSPSVSPDTAPLQLAAVTPEAESVVLSDGFDVVAAADGATIDPARSAVRLRLDGRAVDAHGVTVTRDFVSYTPDGTLPEGSHRVQVEVRDASGRTSSVEWNFYVVGS